MAVPVPLRATCAPRPHSCFRPEGTVRCPLGVCGGPAARRHWRGIASLGSPAHRHHLSYRGRHATARSLPPGPTPSFAILFTWGTGSWDGFAVSSGLLWMLPVAWVIFVLQYRAIARWEGSFLRGIYQEAYDDYARNVRAWIPRWPPHAATRAAQLHPWGAVFFSERGTLLAAGLMAALLIAKHGSSGERRPYLPLLTIAGNVAFSARSFGRSLATM